MSKPKRSVKENASLHKWMSMLAEQFNRLGLTTNDVLELLEIECGWNEHLVKEELYRPVMGKLFGYESTTELERGEASDVAEVINMALAKQGLPVIDWPCDEPPAYTEDDVPHASGEDT